MDEEIKSCPFCGSTEVEIARTNENACWVECAVCGAEAPPTAKREDAIEIWNERHLPSGTHATIVDDGDKEWQEYMKKNR